MNHKAPKTTKSRLLHAVVLLLFALLMAAPAGMQAQEKLTQTKSASNGIDVGVENAQPNTWYVLWHQQTDGSWEVADYAVFGQINNMQFASKADKAGKYLVYSYAMDQFKPKQLPKSPLFNQSKLIGNVSGTTQQ